MKRSLQLAVTLIMLLIISTPGYSQTQLVVNGSFENSGGAPWVQTSTNFGSPLCDLATCGNGTGSGPRTGNVWAWFGGVIGSTETASVSQSFVIPNGGTAILTFWLEQIICDGAQDILEVKIDGAAIFTSNGASPLCGVAGYSQQTIDISSYADGNLHTLLITATTISANNDLTNFFIDDVSVIHTPASGPSCLDTVAFNNLNIPIPDNDSTGIINSQTVSGQTGTLGINTKLSKVCFQINHTWVGDVTVSLTAPNGTEIILLDRPGVPATFSGCPGDNLQVCIESGTGNEVENVCGILPAISGNYTAHNGTNLNTINLNGGSANGTWQLKVTDLSEFDLGSIINWQLIFDGGPVANWTAPDSLCVNASPINLNSLLVGTTGGVWSGQGVNGNIFNPAGLSGSIPVTYTVTDGTGCSDSQTSNISVIGSAPSASFAFTPVSLTTYFNNTSAGGSSYLWNFGDGNTSTLMSPSHTYSADGTYSVQLTVTNVCGSTSVTQSVTVLDCPDVVTDGGFEGGPGAASWNEYSFNFGSPICDSNTCGSTTGSGSQSGSYWAWFGGIAAFEEASVDQTITIPVNSTADLTFWLEQITCDSPSDFLKVAIGTDTIFTTTGSSPLCGQLGYKLQNVNLDSYADGQPRLLKFISRIYGLNGNGSNFFVDDIKISVCTGSGMAEHFNAGNITVSPIPASDFVRVSFNDIYLENVNITLTDITGRTVESLNRKMNGSHTETFNTTSWSRGIYFLKVSSGSQSVNKKILLQ